MIRMSTRTTDDLFDVRASWTFSLLTHGVFSAVSSMIDSVIQRRFFVDQTCSLYSYCHHQCWSVRPMWNQFFDNKIEIAKGNSELNMIFLIAINLQHQLSETDREKSLFPIEFLNVYDRSSMNLPCSNHSMESWHIAFAKRVSFV
jgi:hypothetical protein